MNKNPFVPQTAPPDYAAYWAQQQQQQQQQPATYGGQWTAPQTRTAEQNALYANYGYGAQWQRQQQQQQLQQMQAQYHAPAPAPAPAYNPYQPAAAYPQPYVPQSVAPPPTAYAVQQPQFFPHIAPPQPQPPPQQQQQRHLHHPPPQHLPPAKRPRFDPPNPPPPPPQFQAPPPPPPQNLAFSGPSPRPNHVALGPRAPISAPRGGPPPAQRGARGPPPRGAMSGGRGRGGGGSSGSFMGGGGPRGGGSSNSLRGRGSFGGKDYQNRRGVSGGQSFGGGSFRANRSGQHQGPSRPRHDPSFSARDGPSSGFGRKDENRRTLTDFKIIGFDISDLSWSWGVLPVDQDDLTPEEDSTEPVVRHHPLPAPPHTPPPSRIRIYFHTPVTADDSRPIPHNPSVSLTPSDSRKGKRKKLEDDEPDIEEERARPPPPQMRPINDDSTSASLTETASEDWLMAAIVEGEEAEAEAETQPNDPEEDQERLDVVKAVDNGIHGDVHMWTPEGGSTSELAPEPDAEGACNVSTDPVADHTPSVPPASASAPVPVPVSASASATAVDDSIASSQSTSLVSSVGEHDRDTDADHVALPDTQVPDPSSVAGAIKSLLTVSSEDSSGNTSASADPAPAPPSDDGTAPTANGVDHEETQTQIDPLDAAATQEMDHLPEPPASPLTTLSTSAYGGSPTVSVHKPETKAGRVPSANRLSISYAGGNRRLVVDAEVVESLKLFRQQGRIEVVLNIVKDGDDGLKGILVEGLSDLTKSYLPLQAICDDSECDDTLPPFSKASIPSSITLRVYLDTARPLSEPKWAKSGDVQEWLKSMFGRMFWVAGDAAEGWEKKIQVVDPDPPPTIWTVLDGWAANSPAGVLNERQRFLRTHMADTDNILEILLRLVRGERATASYQSGPAISAPSVSGPLLSALSHGSAHGAQQTHVSLAVLAMFRMAVEYAKKAVPEKGKNEVEERMGEIIRCLPSHLVYKSLDGIFKEWRVEKKGR